MLWTEEAVAVLRTLAGEGRSASAIAEALRGPSRNAVIGKASRIGVRLNGDGRASVAGEERAAPKRASRPSAPPQRKSAYAAFAGAEVGVMARLSLKDIRASACRWPLGEPKDGDFAYCGLAAAGGLPYCPGHCRMAYRPPAVRSSLRVGRLNRTFAGRAL